MMHVNYDEQQPRYLEYLSFLYFLSSVFFLGALVPFHRTMWLSLLLGAALALPLLLALHRLISRFGQGKAMLSAAAAAAACLFAVTLYCFSQFLDACVLQELPMWLFPGAFLLCCAYTAAKDIHVLERFSKLCGPVILILLFLALCSGGAKASLTMEYGFFSWRDFMPPRAQALTGGGMFFALLFLVQYLVLAVLVNAKRKTPAPFKDAAKGFWLSAVFLSASCLVAALALGPDVFELLAYPVYYPPGLTGTAEYLERIEVILLAVFVFSEFVKTSLCLMAIKEALLVIFSKKNFQERN